MKRVLLTGASGLIGKNAIAPLLASGFEVHAVSRRAIAAPGDPRLQWHQVDLLDRGKVRMLAELVQATHLLHFGWYVEHGKFWNAPENNEWLAASLNLIESFVEHGGRRVVGAGTCAEYEWVANDRFDELETPLRPSSLYGECKAELFRRLQDLPVDSAWGRIFFLYGPGEDERRLVPTVITSLLRNEIANCSNGDKVRDFLYLHDVVDAFVRLVGSDYKGPINIASGNATTLREIVSTIGTLLGKTELLRIDSGIASADQPESIVADVTRLSNLLGWHPRFTLDDGLRETIEWWKRK